MPIYEYECSECGRFEIIQKSSDKALKSCPRCKEQGRDSVVTKTISASAFHLKGTGWYKTDYASGSSSSGSSPKKASSKSESSESTAATTEKKDAAPAKGSCGSGCGCH